MCKEGYFGPDCGILCTSRNDSTGHFTCDTNGIKVCLPGYQNPETICVEEEENTVTPKPSSTNIVIELTSNSDVSPSAAGADIVPIVAGGVAAGLVVLVLILIVNIVLVVAYAKVKFMKDTSNKQGML